MNGSTLQAEHDRIKAELERWQAKMREINELAASLQRQGIQAEQQILLHQGRLDGLAFALKGQDKEGDNGGQADA